MKTQLHTAGLASRAPKRGVHRRKRERKPCEGMMLHQDASPARRGLPGRRRSIWVTMDDATSTIYSAILVEEEGTASSFAGLLETFAAMGLPSSLSADRGSHHVQTPTAGEAVDRAHLTQVGRALERLGIKHIPASSPEARGRSERMFGSLQDRLIKELAQAGLGEIAAANAWIRQTYLPAHNARFAKPPALPEMGFVAVHDHTQIVEALSRRDERVVTRDNTIAFDGLRLQLPESPLRQHWVKARVRVHAYPDGTLAVFHGPRRIARYAANGQALADAPTAKIVAACSAPSRRGLPRSNPVETMERRPSLTAPARVIPSKAQVGTKKRPSGQTKQQAGA